MSQKRFPEEFKIEAVKQITQRGHSVAEVSAALPEQLVVVDPASPAGQRDTLGRQFPALWSHGWPGYELAFAQGRYRLWRQRTP